MGRSIGIERFTERGLDRTERVVAQLRPFVRPLATDRDLDPLMGRIGGAHYVLLGEASHGTSEFYTWRARLTQRLIAEKGFAFVAVEGDWPDCQRVDRYVRHRPDAGASAHTVLHAFERWPTWMWANHEVQCFVEWLREHNAAVPDGRRVGFHGLDVYSLWESMAAVVAYLDRVDPEAARHARRAYACFAPFDGDEQEYARATVLVPTSCEADVVRTLVALRQRAGVYRKDDREAWFDAEQNALTARDAERYYRTMVRGGPDSWNVRDGHMVETLDRLVAWYGAGAKAVVWAHNTHIGDARFTDMAADGEVNVGQLVRQAHAADDVVLVGFAGGQGSVIAGDEWGAPMKSVPVPAGRPGSYEDVLHRLGADDKLVLFTGADPGDALLEPRGHRAIGVVYRPQFERYGNYVPTVLPRRYDALLAFDRARALEPLHPVEAHTSEVPETWPTGM